MDQQTGRTWSPPLKNRSSAKLLNIIIYQQNSTIIRNSTIIHHQLLWGFKMASLKPFCWMGCLWKPSNLHKLTPSQGLGPIQVPADEATLSGPARREKSRCSRGVQNHPTVVAYHSNLVQLPKCVVLLLQIEGSAAKHGGLILPCRFHESG